MPMVRSAGFTAFASGGDGRTITEIVALEALDLDREERAFRNGFAGRMARERAADVTILCQDWKPDLLICDETDFGAMIAAEKLGLPHATVITLAAGSFVRPDLIGDTLDAVRAEYGLPPDPQLRMVSEHAVLVPFPPGYRDPAFALPSDALFFRPATAAVSTADTARPLVYLTLGTIFNVESGDLFPRAIAGASSLPVDVIVTTGADLDPAALGAYPANVEAHRYVDQAALLSRCQAVISHAGSGSVLGALAHGVPMVLLPMGADQPSNAHRCHDLGAAIVLDALTVTPGAIAAALNEVLTRPSYRDSARAMAAAFAALPEASSVLPRLEDLLKLR